jgi:hypothetical protein
MSSSVRPLIADRVCVCAGFLQQYTQLAHPDRGLWWKMLDACSGSSEGVRNFVAAALHT